MSNLTQKQQDFLDYLKERLERDNRIPSLREIAADLSISHTAVNQYLKALEDKGHVKRDGRYSRNILLLNRVRETAGPQRWREVPIIGRIAAGLPMYAQQEWDGTIVLDAEMYRGQNLFALRIKGDSMINAGILDGDLAICEPRQFAHNGEIVVALLHGEEATVKRFFLRGDRIELRPENDQYESRYYGFDDILIQGKVVGLNRGPDQIARL